MLAKHLVLIPTYNERNNVARMHAELRNLPFATDIIFVDDNSPDGTGAVLDDIAARDPGVHVLHRSGKLGIGTAHLDGIRWAYRNGYTHLMTMDCDFTHRPEYLPQFMAAAKDCDFVISTRYGADGSLTGWTAYRKTLTRLGHTLTRRMLGMKYDATTSFRLYRLDRIPMSLINQVQSHGYAFFFESVYMLHLSGCKIREVPVVLPPRTEGQSKMDRSEVYASLVRFAKLYVSRFGARWTPSSAPAKQ
jgi:dolichol-phosphate mannosyltransferase